MHLDRGIAGESEISASTATINRFSLIILFPWRRSIAYPFCLYQ
jgi:hypothetical protein